MKEKYNTGETQTHDEEKTGDVHEHPPAPPTSPSLHQPILFLFDGLDGAVSLCGSQRAKQPTAVTQL